MSIRKEIGRPKALYASCAGAVFAFLYWCLYCVFDLDLAFFHRISWGYRLAFLILLVFLAVCLVRLFCRAFVDKEIFSRRFLLYTAINLGILLVLLVFLWPGAYFWDDTSFLIQSTEYDIYPAQHFLSGLTTILSAFFFPSAGGVVFVQIVFIAFVIGYVLAVFELYLLRPMRTPPRCFSPYMLIAELGFLTPSVLLYDYSKFRSTPVAYLELLALAMLLRLMAIKGQPVPWLRVCILIPIVSVFVSWRSENIYYVLFFFLLLLYALGKIYWKQCLTATAVVLVFTMTASRINNAMYMSLIGYKIYSMSAMIGPAVALARTAAQDPAPDGKDDLKAIGKIIDLDLILVQSPVADGAAFYDRLTPYTDADFKEFCLACFRLALRYPRTYLHERCEMFWKAFGFDRRQSTIVYNTYYLFTDGMPSGDLWKTGNFVDRPLSTEWRQRMIEFLGCFPFGEHRPWTYAVFWTMTVPLASIVGFLLHSLRKKKFFFALCLFAVFCKVFLVMLTAPAPYLMYYYSIYLIGFVSLFFALALFLQRFITLRKELKS